MLLTVDVENEGSPPLIYSFLVVECWPMVLETIWFRAACLGFFRPFPHYFIFFLPFLGILLFLEEFWTFLEEKWGFLAF